MLRRTGGEPRRRYGPWARSAVRTPGMQERGRAELGPPPLCLTPTIPCRGSHPAPSADPVLSESEAEGILRAGGLLVRGLEHDGSAIHHAGVLSEAFEPVLEPLLLQ